MLQEGGVYPTLESVADEVVEQLTKPEEEQKEGDWSGLAHEEEKVSDFEPVAE